LRLVKDVLSRICICTVFVSIPSVECCVNVNATGSDIQIRCSRDIRRRDTFRVCVCVWWLQSQVYFPVKPIVMKTLLKHSWSIREFRYSTCADGIDAPTTQAIHLEEQVYSAVFDASAQEAVKQCDNSNVVRAGTIEMDQDLIAPHVF
jgi:hypothetical protein